MSENFAQRVLVWAAKHGRQSLPWQREVSSYGVWVSEIMLQQTRVETVIPYFERFMSEFPTIQALADAPQDRVLYFWSGLGYYARARNLHKAAQILRDQYQSIFPRQIEKVIELPGIGRSTAAAILSLSQNQRHAILDGNVKRVLARHTATQGWPGHAKVEKELWRIAEQRTPANNNAEYTQAIMDLGATLCTRTQPRCEKCPVVKDCAAYASQTQHIFPSPKPKKDIPTRNTVMLIVLNQDAHILMQRRPNYGIWGGLWSFPEFDQQKSALDWCLSTFQQTPEKQSVLPKLIHTFSHFRLTIVPITVQYTTPIHWVMEADEWVWYKHNCSQAGLAAPVNDLIKQLAL